MLPSTSTYVMNWWGRVGVRMHTCRFVVAVWSTKHRCASLNNESHVGLESNRSGQVSARRWQCDGAAACCVDSSVYCYSIESNAVTSSSKVLHIAVVLVHDDCRSSRSRSSDTLQPAFCTRRRYHHPGSRTSDVPPTRPPVLWRTRACFYPHILHPQPQRRVAVANSRRGPVNHSSPAAPNGGQVVNGNVNLHRRRVKIWPALRCRFCVCARVVPSMHAAIRNACTSAHRLSGRTRSFGRYRAVAGLRACAGPPV